MATVLDACWLVDLSADLCCGMLGGPGWGYLLAEVMFVGGWVGEARGSLSLMVTGALVFPV
jgi:hypothetical protein